MSAEAPSSPTPYVSSMARSVPYWFRPALQDPWLDFDTTMVAMWPPTVPLNPELSEPALSSQVMITTPLSWYQAEASTVAIVLWSHASPA